MYTDQEIETLKEAYKSDDKVLGMLDHIVRLQRQINGPPQRSAAYMPGGWTHVIMKGHKND